MAAGVQRSVRVVGSTAGGRLRARTGEAPPDVAVVFGVGRDVADAYADARSRDPRLPDLAPAEAGSLPPRTKAVAFGQWLQLLGRAAWDESIDVSREIPERVAEDVWAVWSMAARTPGLPPAGVKVGGREATELKAVFGAAGTRKGVWLFCAGI